MENGSGFRRLDAWRQARKLVSPIYELTEKFPANERYVLVQQMRKAVNSVHSNIAEGYGRLSNGEWQQFLGQARGSLMELESDLIIAFDRKYCTPDEATAAAAQIKRTIQCVNGCLRKSRDGFEKKKYAVLPKKHHVPPANG